MKSFLTANNEKLTEKAFSSAIITSVLSIVLCIAALCSTSWAWFTGSTASNENTIKTAETFALEFYLDGSEKDNCEIELQKGTYTVTISLPKDSASGYLVMTSNGVSYRSDYIQSHENDTPKSITFYIKVEETPQKVTFTKRWGIYTGDPSVEAGETLTITTKN